MTHATYNAFHLGDNLIHMHFLRKMAQAYPGERFEHFTAKQHVPQLAPLVQDLTNLALVDSCPVNAINAWRGDQNFWYGHPQRHEFVVFHLDWFRRLASRMGLESPIESGADMLFDYPALEAEIENCSVKESPYDYLLINSVPHSNQFRAFNAHALSQLAHRLNGRGYSVITTYPTGAPVSCTHDGTSGMSVTSIGALSVHCRAIVGVATGPLWTTFNVWNRTVPRIVMLDNERLDGLCNRIMHVSTCDEAEAILLR